MKISNLKQILLNNSLLLFAILPLIPEKIKGFPVIFFLLISFLFYKKEKICWTKFIINSSLFFIFIITLLYTTNFSYALKKLETSLSILVLPFCFYVLNPSLKLNENIKYRFYKIFIISVTIYCTILLMFTFFDTETLYYKNWYTNKIRNVSTTISFIGEHPIYSSMYIALSILFYVGLLKNKKFKKNTELIIFSSFIFINLLVFILLMSKGSVIFLAITMMIFLLFDKTFKKHRLKLFGIIIASIIALLISNRRMNELINTETYKNININFSTSIRVGIYKCSIETIKSNWILGYGVGDSQNALNLCYKSLNKYLYKEEYNSHNQYLDIFLKTGVLGFIAFLFFIFFNIKNAFLKKDYIYISVLIFFCFNFLIENILVRQSGIILFYFLICFFDKLEKIDNL